MARPIAKDHQEKRLHILKTAARIFADEGYTRASMAQVAAACGISKANIYHYYDRKDALLFDILDTYLSALRDALCAPAPANQSPQDQLNSFIQTALLAYEGMDAEHHIQTEGLPRLPNDQQRILKGYQREMVARLCDILSRVAPDRFAQMPGQLHPTAMSVFGMLNWYYMWNTSATATDRIEYARLATQIMLNGILNDE